MINWKLCLSLGLLLILWSKGSWDFIWSYGIDVENFCSFSNLIIHELETVNDALIHWKAYILKVLFFRKNSKNECRISLHFGYIVLCSKFFVTLVQMRKGTSTKSNLSWKSNMQIVWMDTKTHFENWEIHFLVLKQLKKLKWVFSHYIDLIWMCCVPNLFLEQAQDAQIGLESFALMWSGCAA